ncbi:MAG: TonB family protein [Glaciecola sp.]
MHSSTLKIALALLLSIAVHSLLLIPRKTEEPLLSQHSIIHARLHKQDRELIQQEQTGQVAQQHNKKISAASDPSQTKKNPSVKQEVSKAHEKTEKQNQNKPVVSSKSTRDLKTLHVPTKDTPTKTKQEKELKELIEKKEVATSQPTAQQSSQVNSDSRAQIQALEGTDDPTYTFYRRVLKQYLGQRLEAKAAFQGNVRLKIKLEYGSIATSVNIIESSGNAEIDNWARRAALAASPYPKIPKEIGLTFEFSPTLQFGQTQ